MRNPEQSSAPFPCPVPVSAPAAHPWAGFPRFWSASWNFHENAGDFCGFPAFFPHFMDSPIHHAEEQPPLLADGQLWQKEVVALSSTCFSWNFLPFFFQQKTGVSAVPSGKALFLVFFCVPSRWLGKGVEINPCAEHSEAELFRSIPSLHSHTDTPFLALPLATSTWRF